MDLKKAREQAFLSAVKALYPAFPAGEVVPDEPPDFWVVGEHSTTAIEMVDYIRGQGEEQGGSPIRRSEVIRRQVASRAKAIFEETHDVPLMVHFTWNDHEQVKQSDVEKYAASAAAVVAENIPGRV